jgi:NADH-quinone oxidoreductase subunit L
MHAMDDDVDMRRYGALRGALPITFITFTAGYLAIIGFPAFSGFFSKDLIIEAAFADNLVVGLVTLVGAGITAFYMTRLMIMTFFGRARDPDAHPHESPPVMTFPLVVLGLLSAAGGAALLYLGSGIITWLEPVTGEEEHELGVPVWVLTAVTLAVIAVGVVLAYARYGTRPVTREAPVGSVVARAAREELYGNQVNEALLMRPGQYLTRTLVYVDNKGIDGMVRGLAAAVGGSSGRLRRWQTGFVRSYALSMLGGGALVIAALFLARV